MREFNTAGPCHPGRHYMLPPLRRLPEATDLVDRMGYFVVHAPRQTGKTTSLVALADELTGSGRYAALRLSCEDSSVAGEDYGAVQRVLLEVIRDQAMAALPPELAPPPWPEASDARLLGAGLAAWARVCPRPLVLFFDEVDSLEGLSLVSVLRQLRNGHTYRPDRFPHSVVLCGMRDVRDYRAAAGSGDPNRLGSASPFNIKVKSLRIGDFTAEEVAELYGQHTADTGQQLTDEAVARVFEYTRGQPWLVNALAREITVEMGVRPPVPITVDHVDEAKERLILARASHLDSLDARLAEPRVRKVIEPLVTGELQVTDMTYANDVAYLRDLGLLASTKPAAIANPIYREVIVRILASSVEEAVKVDPRAFVLPDGRLDAARLLDGFIGFWRDHAEILVQGTTYHQASAQLVFMAYLQRVVNGGGSIDREYGVGMGRIDVLVRWPYLDSAGKRHWQREAIEIKVWHPDKPDPTPTGLAQLDGYLDRLGLDHGILMVFDQRRDAPPLPQRTQLAEVLAPSGRKITLLRA